MNKKNQLHKRISSLLALIIVFVLSVAGCGNDNFNRSIYSIDDLEGKTVIMLNNTLYDKLIKERLSDVQIKRADSNSDLILNVSQGKADALVATRYGTKQYADSVQGLAMLDEPIGNTSFAVLFSDTDVANHARVLFNEYLKLIKSNGVLDELARKWLESYDENNEIDFSGLKTTGETIHLAVSSTMIPYSFYENGQYKGFEIELMVKFCKEYGYNLKISEGDNAGMISDLQSGIRDVAVSGYEIKDYEPDGLYYSDPVISDDVVLIVKESDVVLTGTDTLTRALSRTFVEDDRYLEFIDGIMVTLKITIPSMIFGTIIGFLLYFLKLTGNRVAKGVLYLLCLITERVPSLVLLMIFYYVIFSAFTGNAINVAIITFSYMFSINTYNNICDQVDSIPQGQDDAAYLLGFNKYESFLHIVFPQSLVGFLERFKGDFISHMLDTSIVSLIAISDLAGVGDRIRDMTLQSFMPIISVSIIYFVISTIVIIILSTLQKRIDPKKRTKEAILKGIDY